jgi:pimeloyl-ACP methyl ester carboxylesterase
MHATKGDYAEVNGLRMYYEVHGSGRPLVLLHGAYMTVDAMGSILPGREQAGDRRIASLAVVTEQGA